MPQSFTHAPAQFLEKLTNLPSDAAKIVSPSTTQKHNMRAFKPLLLFGGNSEREARTAISKSLKIERKKPQTGHSHHARGVVGRSNEPYEFSSFSSYPGADSSSMNEDIRKLQTQGWPQFKNKTFHFDEFGA